MRAFVAVLSSLAIPAAVFGAPTDVVNWGGQYVANSQSFQGSYSYESGLDLDGDTNNDDSRFGYGVGATPLSPANVPPGAYSGTSSTFYGGFVINTINADSNGDSVGPNGQGVHQNGATDHIKMLTQHSGNHHHTFAFLVYWDKADFLNGGSTVPVALDGAGSFSFTPRSNSNITAETHLHFIVRDGSQFYVSEAFWSNTVSAEPGWQGLLPDNATTVFDATSPEWGSWQPYNPSGLGIQFTHGGFVTPTLSNVTAVGFYLDTLVFSANTNNLEIDGFSVVANPVPEPGPLAVALLIGVFAVTSARRRLLS